MNFGSDGKMTTSGSLSPVQNPTSGVGIGVSASGPIGRNGSWNAGVNVNSSGFRFPAGVTFSAGIHYTF